VELVYHEPFASEEQAVWRERQLKGGTHAKNTALIAGDLARLGQLARSH